MSNANNISSTPSGAGKFATTHWSVVLAAVDSSSPQHREALSELCQKYWFPLYAYLRRCGYDSHQAEDYTQGFFAQMLEKNYLHKVEPKPGKFRSFLLAALRHFVADQHDRARAVKRGGAARKLPFDFERAEGQYIHSLVYSMSPEKLFERSWAVTILQKTMDRLEVEFTRMNKQMLFAALSTHLGGQGTNIMFGDKEIIK